MLMPVLPSRDHTIYAVLTIYGLTGCSSHAVQQYFPDQRLQYQRQIEATANLELPPDLTAVPFDDALDIPAPDGTATYSAYVGTRAQQRQQLGTAAATTTAVLPTVSGVTIAQGGGRRWLVVSAVPAQVWPLVVGFWRQQGIVLVEQNPTTGVMQTDWLENRAEIRKDVVTRLLRKVVDGMYATGTRDQYRLRVDQGTTPQTTEVFITHRGMEERLANNALGQETNSVWTPTAADPDKEAEMLRRLMLHLGVPEQRAQQALTAAPAAPAASPHPAAAQLTVDDSHAELVLTAPRTEAWRRVGLALDRTGFAVVDRNREQGIFFVRYDDPNRDTPAAAGWTQRLAFWRRDQTPGVEQYQVRLVEQTGRTHITVHDRTGTADVSPTAGRILSLLAEQLR